MRRLLSTDDGARSVASRKTHTHHSDCCPMNRTADSPCIAAFYRAGLHFRNIRGRVVYRSSYCIKLIPIWPKIKKIKRNALHSVSYNEWRSILVHFPIYFGFHLVCRCSCTKFISTRLEIISAIIKSVASTHGALSKGALSS